MKIEKLFGKILILLIISQSLYAQSLTDLSVFKDMKPRNIGPAGMSGRVTAIDVVLKDTKIIYIGSAAGGVWKSVNAGHTWNPIFDNELAASIGDIKIFQKNPSIIYVGTGEGNPRNSQNSGVGMFKSLDAGKSWIHLGLRNSRQIHRVLIHPENPDIVWAGISGATWGDSEERGVYKTINGGKTWNRILYVDEKTGVADMVVDPANPNKILVAMWEHRRSPWFFKSGGNGSALYMTVDGGETWKKLGKENGLPSTELGRMGLSFSPSNTSIVYAYIESKVNAIYKSSDGGYQWVLTSKPKDRQIGDRPFYYADIYADSQNENRIYSIASEITVSEDGGKNWQMFASGNKVHTDHHAWWSHPGDSNFIIIGHDGGLNISHDRGQNWWFADNLPLGQFYHLRLDNSIPYHIIGGLQDNGTWRGPNRSWFKGGIRNMYWQRLSVGDGFDAIPDPIESDYGYAMGQAGNLVRYHIPSGQLYKIMPQHPDGVDLRFNWNAGIAIDPIDKKTIYYGSQFLHRTRDNGLSWEIVSPDLTTNNPEKQKYNESGGLTYDVTGAENHTTIISIDPSPLNSGVIWVGTDDGNVQLTKDGGKTWRNLIGNIKNVPSFSWVTQIKSSLHNPAEAFVVFDDHRRNNWTPYIFHTVDYGETWTRLVDDNDVHGYTYCIEQDPITPNLLFVGTEFGLYLSFNKGETWSKWTNGLPTVPITDLAIHARDHDLVLATFGRSFWILDNILPLREIAKKGWKSIADKKIYAFDIPDEHLMAIGESIGYRDGKVGDALYNGENRPVGSLISYYSSLENDKDITVEIHDQQGVIRKMSHKAQKGINTLIWDMKSARKRRPWQAIPAKQAKEDLPGIEVSPGKYEVYIVSGKDSAKNELVILGDPRLEYHADDVNKKMELFNQFEELVLKATETSDKIRAFEKALTLSQDLVDFRKPNDHETLTKELKAVRDSIASFWTLLIGKDVQGIYRDDETIRSQIGRTEYMLDFPLAPAGENISVRMSLLEKAIDQYISESLELTKKWIDPLRNKLAELDLNPVRN